MTGAPHRRSPAADVVGDAAEAEFREVWSVPPGLGRLSAVNSSVVGRRFIATGFAFFLAGGILALLIRTQLLVPENDFLTPEAFNQIFTMHGTTMMFLFAVPIMEAFGMYLIPSMIGTRDLCFPRLSAFGYWCYLFGGLLLYSSFLVDAVPDGGWFMYLPLTSKAFSPGANQDFWLLGVTFVEVASISGALELIVTILRGRAPGMSLSRMPIFAWYMLGVSFMVIIGFPPLVLASVMLEVERAFDIPFFDVTRGGDPLLWQHLFWIFGHPEVYIIFLPAAGLVSAMLPALARAPLALHEWLVLAVVGTAFLSFGLWVHHMYATGIPVLALALFSGASMAVAVPSGIQVFAWIATLWRGRPAMSTPLLFVIGFIIIFVLGGITGVMVAVVPFDWQVHDSYFVVAHFHYVLIGGMVFPLFAALHFYMPHASGRRLSEKLGRATFWLLFVGFNVAFLPMHWTGLVGMPRRVYTYPADAGWDALNLVSSIGAYAVAAGALVFLVNVAVTLRRGQHIGHDNPWRAPGLEWADETPSPPSNLRSIPRITSRYPLWEQEGLDRRILSGQELLATAPERRREVLVTSTGSAEPEYVHRLPGPTWIPVIAAAALAVVFIGFLVSMYTVSAVAAAAFVAIVAVWLWEEPPEKDSKDVGHGIHLPIAIGDRRAAGWGGAIVFLLVLGVIFVSLVFSYLFLWTSAAGAWPPHGRLPEAGSGALGTAALLVLALPAALVAGRAGSRGGRVTALFALALLLLVLAAAIPSLLQAQRQFGLQPYEHAYAAIVFAFGCLLALVIAISAGAAAFALARAATVGVSPARSLAVRVAALFSACAAVQGLVSLAVVYALPRIGG